MTSRLIKKLRNQSLSRRIVVIALILGVTMSVAGLFLQVTSHHYWANSELNRRAERAWKLSVAMYRLHAGTPNDLTEALQEVVKALRLDSLELRDAKGLELQYYGSREALGFLEHQHYYVKQFSHHGRQFELKVVVRESLLPIGVRVQLALSVGVGLIIIFILSWSMIYFVRQAILRHLSTIADYAKNVSASTLFETLVLNRSKTRTYHDELDELSDAIEQMRQQLIDDLDQRRAIELALIAEKEEKLETRKMIEEAKASDRAKSQFIATMSHEIRTPMNGVIGMVEMLKGTVLNKEQHHYVEVIGRSSDSLMNIINDILDYSKIEAGKMSLECIEFDLKVMLQDCLTLFGGTAVKKKVELMYSIAPHTPTLLFGDPTRIKQVLVNMIGNAFKFTAQGSIFVEAYSMNAPGDALPTLHFSVADSGIGIDTNAQNTIFEAFKQADSTTTRKYGGTGLGLAICKHLVELMGGRIGVQSEKEKGSCFWFTCPLSLGPTNQQQMSSSSLALAGKNLLFVHPMDYLDLALRGHCRASGMHCDIAHSIHDAWLALNNKSKRPDFILINEDMGEKSGLGLAQEIRNIDEYFSTPIMMLTNLKTANFSLDQLMPISSVLTRPIGLQDIIQSLLSESSGISLSELMPTKQDEGVLKANLNVLVAEDNIVNRMVIEGLLEKLNINPDFSENGREVFERYSSLEKKYDLIFMDCEMPEMDGFEATLKIRRWESDRGQYKVPIIALTAHVEAEHRQRVFDVGMNYYVSKPVTLEKLSEALSSVGLC